MSAKDLHGISALYETLKPQLEAFNGKVEYTHDTIRLYKVETHLAKAR